MAGTLVVAMAGDGGGATVDGPLLAASVRSLVLAGWNVVVMADRPGPEDGHGSALALALGQSRSGRRAVPVLAHVLVDPADPALARPPAADQAEPLAIVEAEAIASLIGSFPVVVTAGVAVVPHGDAYRPVVADLDPAATARRLAGDLGAGVLAFVTGGEGGPSPAGEIDVVEAERRAAGGGPLAAELEAAARFLRAGGELAVVTPPDRVADALDHGPAGGVLRIRRTVDRPRSTAPALTAGWC